MSTTGSQNKHHRDTFLNRLPMESDIYYSFQPDLNLTRGYVNKRRLIALDWLYLYGLI